jgi:hypothetical protein
VLPLEGGFSATFTDDESSPDTYKIYQYVRYLKVINHHLVHVNYYEGDAYILVSNRTGQKIFISNVPEISPDGHKLAVVSAAEAYNFSGIVILKWTPHGYIEDARYEPGDSYYQFVKWEGSDRIALRRNTYDSSVCGDGGYVSSSAVMRRHQDRWRIEYDSEKIENCTFSP